MGKGINTGYRDKRPFVFFDGKYLFFAIDRIENKEMPNETMNLRELRQLLHAPANGWEHIYRVDIKEIDEFMPKN